MVDAPVPAAPPAPHQIAAFNAAKLQSTVVTILGAAVAAGNEIVAAVQQTGLVPHAHWLTIAGTLLVIAGRIEYAVAHLAFQQSTDN